MVDADLYGLFMCADDPDRLQPLSVSGSSACSATATASGSSSEDKGVWPIVDDALNDAGMTANRRRCRRHGSHANPNHPLGLELTCFLNGLDHLRAALALAQAPMGRRDEEGHNAAAWCAWHQAAIPLDGVDVRRDGKSRVVSFCGGVYRGQVVRAEHPGLSAANDMKDADAVWIPGGYGVWTRIEDGRSVLGRWAAKSAGCMQCCGHLLRPGLSFEGEWVDGYEDDGFSADGFTGVGVGTFAFGGVFTGPWAASAPNGLGELVGFNSQVTTNQNLYTCGWVCGIRCVQPCGSTGAVDAKAASRIVRDARRQFPDQPERGLVVAALALERWRAKALTRTVTQWRRCACHQSVRTARFARLDAVRARNLALEAEARAIHLHLQSQQQDQRSRREGMDALILQSQTASEKRRRTRERHSKIRREAQEQLELARACAQRQREAVDALESELSATLELLVIARQAQSDCHTSARELVALKRQIENVSVQINALRQRIRDGHLANESVAGELDANRGGPELTLGLPPSRPATAATQNLSRVKNVGAALSQVDVLTVEAADAQGVSVCDVPGCGCGIPRDVFLRVASTLNGDE